MLSTIKDYTNSLKIDFNDKLLSQEDDISIEEYTIITMKEFEAIENIEILGYEIITNQDEIDYNYHTTNINFKRKNLDKIEIPKFKFITDNRYNEIKFTIKIETNLNKKIIEKKILIPVEDDGFYLLSDKRWKKIWQLCDASTYSQRGKITLKSRMPIIIYNTKNRRVVDDEGNEYFYQSFSYALNTKTRRGSTKTKVKFINPLMIFSAKMGLRKTIAFFGFSGIIDIVDKVKDDKNLFRYYPLNELFIKVDNFLVDKYPMIQNFICMMQNLQNKDFPVKYECVDNKNYWICRIGYIGSVKNRNISTFEEKGRTTIYMIERLLNNITIKNLRLPNAYKCNIYFVLRWMIENYNFLKPRNNMDLNFKRLRKNEYIVDSSLGKKVSTNINKLIERRTKSRLNNMETLLELFNFNSDIILSGMKNINDLVKSDELVNDLTFLQDIAYSAKGPNSLGESSSKAISNKYRDIHISYIGKIDCNTSSNSDPGLSGSLTPFVNLYDGFYFSPEREPCRAHYDFVKEKQKYFKEKNISSMGVDCEFDFDSFDEFRKWLDENNDPFYEDLQYEKIQIIEKEEDANKSSFSNKKYELKNIDELNKEDLRGEDKHEM